MFGLDCKYSVLLKKLCYLMDAESSPTCDDIKTLFDEIEENKTEQQNVLQKLQAIRLWQLKQQEELKKQQLNQLALLKSQSFEKVSLQAKLDAVDIEDDDVLAVPIENLADPSDKIQEQLTIYDDEDLNTVENCLQNPNDSILLQLQNNMQAVEENTPVDQLCCNKEGDVFFHQKDNEHEASISDVQQNAVDLDASEELHSDIEASFEKSCTEKQVSFDELPVKAGQTFEEILSAQLAQEDEVKVEKQSSASTPKRPFLRKGQGIARFKGPPKRTLHKKKPDVNKQKKDAKSLNAFVGSSIKHDADHSKSSCDSALSSIKVMSNYSLPKISSGNDNANEIKHKPCIRKTARLTKKEPIKNLVLKPEVGKFPPVVIKSPPPDEFQKQEYHNDSVWSDGADPTLALETSEINDYNTTSNETFEQMEKFCNEHYADVSSVKTLDGDDSVIMKKIDPLPPNKLMQRLFPSLRNEAKTKGNNHPPVSASTKIIKEDFIAAKENEKTSSVSSHTNLNGQNNEQCVNYVNTVIPSDHPDQSTVLKSKLEEMETEIKHFQEESAKLTTVRKQEENQLQLLKQEFDEFQRQKEEELQRLSEFKKSEMKKLKKDRKLFEDHVAATKALPNKRDREYIQELENKITDLQNEFKLKEQRINAASSRLRTQLEVVTDENVLLKDKIKELEDEVSKLKHAKELKKNKQSQLAWKAINDIVDSIPMNDENVNSNIHINSKSKLSPKPLQFRSPLVDMNHNNQLNNSQITVHDGKTEHRKKDGSLEISFQNGTKKFVFPNGTTQIKFTNGDIKTIQSDGIVKYHYTSSGTLHTTHPNGMQVIEFSNKQIERHFPDGSKHISFEDGSSKMIKLNGLEETIYPDGTVMTVSPSGDKKIEFSNGQREIHTSEFKRREYPDGTCKTVFSDGRQETRYSSGRLRIKDADGILLVDKILPA